MRVEPFVIKLGEIVMVNLVLSGDNALLIALATSRLPKHQRKTAMAVGIIAAMALRALLTEGAAVLIGLPFVRAAGAVLLAGIALNLSIGDELKAASDGGTDSFLAAIGTILLADALMSVDNVAALAGMAGGDFRLLVAGLGISMIVMIFASASIGAIIERYRHLVLVGSAVLAFTAGKLLADDQGLHTWLGGSNWPPLCLMGLCVVIMALNKSNSLRAHRPSK